MMSPGPLLVRDFASTLLDIVPDAPCSEDTVACTLRSLVEYLTWSTLVFGVCVALGFLAAIWVSVAMARLERRPVTARRRRLVSGPIHTDGTWVRLVEYENGRRVIEVLEGANWRPSDTDLSHLLLDLPVVPQPRG